jgi:AraC-like DNA-binding protein
MKSTNNMNTSGEQHERSRIARIKKYVLDNLNRDLNASVVANQFEMSVSSLQHLFQKYQGQSYHKYVEDMRMVRAFDLITKEGMRIQQAMFATGYKYKSTFNKSFKRRFGHSPRHYKK